MTIIRNSCSGSEIGIAIGTSDPDAVSMRFWRNPTASTTLRTNPTGKSGDGTRVEVRPSPVPSRTATGTVNHCGNRTKDTIVVATRVHRILRTVATGRRTNIAKFHAMKNPRRPRQTATQSVKGVGWGLMSVENGAHLHVAIGSGTGACQRHGICSSNWCRE